MGESCKTRKPSEAVVDEVTRLGKGSNIQHLAS